MRASLGLQVTTPFRAYPEIAEITPDSPAAKAGIKVGDVILAIDDVSRPRRDHAVPRRKPISEDLLIRNADGGITVTSYGRGAPLSLYCGWSPSHPRPGSFCWFELATSIRQRPSASSVGLGWSVGDQPGPSEMYSLFRIDGKDVAAAHRFAPDARPFRQ
jgi:hypothetical protein